MKPLMVPDLLPPTEEMEEKAHRIFNDLLEVRDFLAENNFLFLLKNTLKSGSFDVIMYIESAMRGSAW